jgi:sugar transferase (PEP-CTERM system associated)
MLKISNHYISKVVFSLLFLEVMILIGAFYAGAGVRFFDGEQFTLPRLDHFFMSACIFAAAIVFSMSALGMYQINFQEGLRNPFFLQLMPSFAMGFCILTLVFYLAPDLYFGRGILVLVYLFAASGILTARSIFLKTSRTRFLESRIMFLGGGTLAKECGDLAVQPGNYRKYDIAGFVPVPSEDVAVAQNKLLNLGEHGSLVALANAQRVTEIVVSVQNRRGGAFPIKELLECKTFGIQVTDAATFFERETCQIRVDSLQPSWLVFGGGFDQSFARTFMKRACDLVASLALLLVTLPLMLLTALAIWLEDGAPVFYSQERVGKDGRVFKVLKFRSMFKNAEKNGTPQWASKNDPRITRVGNIIRKLRIDELPQILNVLKGEMSFVGPRPERPYFVDQLGESVAFYNVRHSIKPGITGWAQVRYGYGDSVQDALQKLQYDLYYVKNNSLLLDVLVLIDTFKVVMFRGGR